MQHINSLGTFDLRSSKDRERLKKAFSKMLNDTPQRAAALLNSDTLRFPALFVLMPEICACGAFDKLNPKNKAAALLCAVADPQLKLPDGVARELAENKTCQEALKWALMTGYKDDGLCGEYDRALDVSACYLERIYRDTSVLPVIVELIFRRNRKGQYIGDLVWALFSSKEPKILRMIARYLASPDSRDTELAEKLLKNAGVNAYKDTPRSRKYAACSSWLKENEPYITFTDESFQQSCEPELFKVNLEAKYLCKKPSDALSVMRSFSAPLSDRAEAFRHLSPEQQEKLARYSRYLYRLSRRRWNRFMSYPIERQLKIAGRRVGSR